MSVSAVEPRLEAARIPGVLRALQQAGGRLAALAAQ